MYIYFSQNKHVGPSFQFSGIHPKWADVFIYAIFNGLDKMINMTRFVSNLFSQVIVKKDCMFQYHANGSPHAGLQTKLKAYVLQGW